MADLQSRVVLRPSRPSTAPTRGTTRPKGDYAHSLEPFRHGSKAAGTAQLELRRRDKLLRAPAKRLYDSSDMLRGLRLASSLPLQPTLETATSPPRFSDLSDGVDSLPNLSRSLRADWDSLMGEREQLKAERASLAAERTALEALREEQRHEAAALAEQRSALLTARKELQDALPEQAAGRIQAHVRAIRARVEFGRIRAQAAESTALRSEARASERALAAQARNERAQLRRAEEAAMTVQSAVRQHRSREHVTELRRERARELEVRQREMGVLRDSVHSKLRAHEQAAAAKTMQAVARRRKVRAEPPTQARQARRAHRAKVERQLAEDRASRELQRMERGRRARAGAQSERRQLASVAERERRTQREARQREAAHVRRMFLAREKAVQIQRASRGYLARRDHAARRANLNAESKAKRQHLGERVTTQLRQQGAARSVQGAVRQLLARRKVGQLRQLAAQTKQASSYREEVPPTHSVLAAPPILQSASPTPLHSLQPCRFPPPRPGAPPADRGHGAQSPHRTQRRAAASYGRAEPEASRSEGPSGATRYVAAARVQQADGRSRGRPIATSK